MKLYRLSATLTDLDFKFEFAARDDNEARELVAAFSRVCQPMSHGPLEIIGTEKDWGGLTLIDRDETKAITIPLDIEHLPKKD
jgi:hypothetical protein